MYLQIPDKYLKQGKKIEQYRQDYKTLISVSAYLLTAIDNFLFLEGRLRSLKFEIILIFPNFFEILVLNISTTCEAAQIQSSLYYQGPF